MIHASMDMKERHLPHPGQVKLVEVPVNFADTVSTRLQVISQTV